MRTCEYAGEPPLSAPRSHPWCGSAGDAEAGYHDLIAQPELIRSSLEDFVPFAEHAAVEQFYALLERINHPKSPFESSDCAFNGPAPSDAKAEGAFECSGRVVLLYRAVELNTSKSRISWLKNAFHQQLMGLDRRFTSGVIGTTVIPVSYLALPPAARLGEQLMLSFWAFGETEALTMQNLARLMTNLTRALRGVAARSAPIE